MKKLKVLTVVGTRPEIIRLSQVIKRLDKSEAIEHVLVHTGQNYNYELNEIFFKDLELREPDHYLNASGSNAATTAGNILIKIDSVLDRTTPDAFLVLGDTNSCLSAIAAKKRKIPVFHMEAGNRCFDERVPEEVNRRIIDHIADYNLVYTEHARRHLISEGLPHRRIYLTGSPMNEVLAYNEEKIRSSTILNKLDLENKKYFIVSTHREENVDDPEKLKKIITILNNLTQEFGYPIIVSTHPRTEKRLENLNEFKIDERIKFLKPFGFTDYVFLQMNALCTISDSGTISEESAILSFPAISLRESMERPEAQDAGTIILTGFDPDVVMNSIKTVIDEHNNRTYEMIPPDYQIGDTSWRVLKLILGNTKLSNQWSGIDKT